MDQDIESSTTLDSQLRRAVMIVALANLAYFLVDFLLQEVFIQLHCLRIVLTFLKMLQLIF